MSDLPPSVLKLMLGLATVAVSCSSNGGDVTDAQWASRWRSANACSEVLSLMEDFAVARGETAEFPAIVISALDSAYEREC